MRFVGFIGPSYKLSSVNVDCQRCINLYPELDEIGTGKEREIAALVSTPGLRLLTTFPAGPNRGVYCASNGSLFAVYYNKLYQVSSTWAKTEIGTIGSTTGQVSMADNGIDLVLVDGAHGYSWNFLTSTLSTITDEDFPGADQVLFQDGYFIFNEPDTGNFFISDLDSVIFNDEHEDADSFPDKLMSIISDHRDLWLFGTQTTEVWFNSGNTDFPFQRVQGAVVEHGCAARFSVAKMNNTVFWLGQDDKGKGMIFEAKGYQPTRISTHALEEAIQRYGDISDAIAYTYQEGGHHFYVLNFPTANTTWAFDATTNLWHERIYTNAGRLERHRANSHAFAFGIHVVGDYENGNIYELTREALSDAGVEITRRRIAPHISEGLKRITYNSIELDIESGTGIDGLGQGVDPQAMLQYSEDGGHTWSNEKWTSFGKIGQTKRRAIWRRLGMSRDRVFSVTITDPVRVTMLGAELNSAQGGN